jgi:hypothetical protein
MRSLLALNLLNYGKIMKYVGCIKFMLQANKFNKHPILMVNVIEFIFIFLNNFKTTIQITSIKYCLFKEDFAFFFLIKCSMILKLMLLLNIMNISNFRVYFIK